MTEIQRALHLFAQLAAILVRFLLLENSQLSTSHEAALEAQVHMLPRTDPLETNSRIHHPFFCTHPGWGGRYLLDRRFHRPKNQSGRSDQKALTLPGIEHRSTIAQPRQCTDYGIRAPPDILHDLGTLP